MMKKLVGNTMSGILEVVLWLNLVGGAISGYNIAGIVGSSKGSWGSVVNAPSSYYIAGVILGILVGFLVNVFEGGFFLLLMEIRNYAKETRDYVAEIAERDYTATVSNETTVKSNVSAPKDVKLDMNSLLR
jgi:hypothetical protein